jgi:hypothetical protein
MRLWIALVAVAPACGFHSQTETPPPPSDGQVDIDAPSTAIDAAIDAMIPLDAQACFGTLARVCFTTMPTAAVVVDTRRVIDTNDPAMCDANHDQTASYCVIAGTSFTILKAGTVRASGNKPLVLISTSGTFQVAGLIDVSSAAGTNLGAGGNSSDCVAGTAATGTSGGYGGSFGGVGGSGKTIDGAGGAAPAGMTAFPGVLRGGCSGGDGAGDPDGGGHGGNGGGAVQIVAPKVDISGSITASGAGGHGGDPEKCGGGGGGAGGMIVIESPMITTTPAATLFANGGGGAQGGEMKGSGKGADGGESLLPLVAALGGKTSGNNGGAGGNGAAGTGSKDGDAAVNSAGGMGGGGGGGGASGFIRAPGATSPLISPAPQ